MKTRKKNAKDRVENICEAPLLTGKFHIDDSFYAKMQFENDCRSYIDMGNSLLNDFIGFIFIRKYGVSIIIYFLVMFAFYLVVCSFSLEFLVVISIILCAFISLIALLKIIYTFFVEPRILVDNIKATSCYKKIIERIKESNLNEIKYIYSNKSKVVLCDNSNNTIDIYYKNFDFPDLSIDKQPLLIVGIINDICGSQKKNFRITNKYRDVGLKSFDCDSESYTYGKDRYSFENLFVATNNKLMKR